MIGKILFLQVIILTIFLTAECLPIVETEDGKVQGFEKQTVGNGTNYFGFFGIPFAEAPVGRLRFEPPIPKAKWSGILNATKEGNTCPQLSKKYVVGDEDCLYVNVYTPSITKKDIPVMVWIYGGGFFNGSSSNEVYAPDYFLEHDIVVVTFNYRVGIFGFLSTGDSVVPGNNGLKDQVLALRWVQRNIAAFGGDPKKVTISGESAGAASVSYMLHSPVTKGLFSAAIIQSGTSLSPWANASNLHLIRSEIGKRFDVDSSNSQMFVDYLKSVPYPDLAKVASSVFGQVILDTGVPKDGLPIGPVIEVPNKDAFVTEKTHQSLVEGKFQPVPILIGFTSTELNFDLPGFASLFIRVPLFLEYYVQPRNLVPTDLNLEDRVGKLNAGIRLRDHYFQGKVILNLLRDFLKYCSDDQFVKPTREFVRILSNSSNVYLYRFSYYGEISENRTKLSKGVGHGEDIPYFWKTQFTLTKEDDLLMRKKLLILWTNFVKYHNPTPKADALLDNVIWPRSNSQAPDDYVYLELDKELAVKTNPEAKSMELWDDLYNKYAVPPLNTY